MAKIVSIGTAVPPHCMPQDVLREEARIHFGQHLGEISRLLPIFDNVEVRQRYFCVPIEWFYQPHTFLDRNDTYIEWAERLSHEAIEKCLNQAEVAVDEIDHLLFVSTTGMSTPSIDAHLINRMGFDPHVKRTPIFGLGCAGGAAGLAHCLDLLQTDSTKKVLLVSIEISSLTFQPQDFTKSNLVATALFADGAAAALVCGDGCQEDGVQILDAQSTLHPKTADVMGWRFTDTGLQVIFSRRIPALVTRFIRNSIDSFVAPRNLTRKDLAHYAIHPGGAKILTAFENSLDVCPDDLVHSRFVLENYGNMSSPTVLFVLNHLLESGVPKPGDYGLGAAFGPGFSSELFLLHW